MIKKLLEWFQSKENNDSPGKLPKKYGYIIVIGLAGLLLILLGNMFTGFTSKDEQPPSDPTTIHQDEEAEQVSSKDSSLTSNVSELEDNYKAELENMLNDIQGVSDVEVMINLDSTNVKVYEKNLISNQQLTDENDKSGGKRQIEDHTEETEVVLVRQGDQEVPLLIQTKKPKVRGVLVTAKGVDHATVKQWVVESTSRVLDVPTHRVSVMPKK